MQVDRMLCALRRVVFACALAFFATACTALGADSDGVGVGITGIDHLDEHLSVQNFWVDGYNAAQAGKGGRTVCCAMLPRVWRPGLTVEIRWEVGDWKNGTWTCHVRRVPVERYEEVGQLWVHFLADGSVRAVSSVEGPRSPTYPGPHDPIPNKNPWDKYPLPAADPDCHQRADTEAKR